MFYIMWKTKFVTPELSIARNKKRAACFEDKRQAIKFFADLVEIIIRAEEFGWNDLKIVEEKDARISPDS